MLNCKGKWPVAIMTIVAMGLIFASVGFAAEIDGRLASKMATMDGDELVRVMVRMQEQPFVSSAMGKELTRHVLKEAAERTQRPVLQYLTARHTAGDVRAFNNFWIVNVVFAEIRATYVAELSRLPGVAYIYEDFDFTLAVEDMTPVEAAPNMLRWDHVAAVFAPEAWSLGYRGQGVTVAVIDTGVDISHPDLAGAFGGEGPYYEGYWAEFDRDGHIVPNSRPRDTGTHGTHVSGTVGARNLTHQIGVAPEVTLAHGLVLPYGSGSFPQVLAGMYVVRIRFTESDGETLTLTRHSVVVK